jgi:hypothetical protein
MFKRKNITMSTIKKSKSIGDLLKDISLGLPKTQMLNCDYFKIIQNYHKIKYNPKIDYEKFYKIGEHMFKAYEIPLPISNTEYYLIPVTSKFKQAIISQHAYDSIVGTVEDVNLDIEGKFAIFDFSDYSKKNSVNLNLLTTPITLKLIMTNNTIFLSSIESTIPFIYTSHLINPRKKKPYDSFTGQYYPNKIYNFEIYKFFMKYLYKNDCVREDVQNYLNNVEEINQDNMDNDKFDRKTEKIRLAMTDDSPWFEDVSNEMLAEPGKYLSYWVKDIFVMNSYLEQSNFCFIVKSKFEFKNVRAEHIHTLCKNSFWNLYENNTKIGIILFISNWVAIEGDQPGCLIYYENNFNHLSNQIKKLYGMSWTFGAQFELENPVIDVVQKLYPDKDLKSLVKTSEYKILEDFYIYTLQYNY